MKRGGVSGNMQPQHVDRISEQDGGVPPESEPYPTVTFPTLPDVPRRVFPDVPIDGPASWTATGVLRENLIRLAGVDVQASATGLVKPWSNTRFLIQRAS